MPNIASLLKSEITRVARREARAETTAFKKTSSAQRAEVAALKRRVQALEGDLRRLAKDAAKVQPVVPVDTTGAKYRFSATGMDKARQWLGLSGADCGRLHGASPQAIYNWEQGKARPQERHMAAISALRGMGPREAAGKLATLPTPAD